MKLNVNINTSPVSAATAGIEFGSQFFWKDTVNLQIEFSDVDQVPSWAGNAIVKVNLTDDENYPLIDTQTMTWAGTTAESLVALDDFRIDTYLDGVLEKPCYLEVQIENNTEKQTVVKQQFQLLNTFMQGFVVELTEPLEPDLLEVEQFYPPAAPDQLSVIKFPENVLEINAIIIDGNEQYTPYEPSNVIALLTNQCRPPEDVEASVTPAEPDQVDVDISPLAPDQLSAGEIPAAPSQLALAISPLAPSLLEVVKFPEEPDQVEADTTPLAPDLPATQQLTPAPPSMINVGIDDFLESRYEPVVHLDMSLEDDTYVFDEYDPATDPSPTTTQYAFKLDNLVGICDGEALSEDHDQLYVLQGYYKKIDSYTISSTLAGVDGGPSWGKAYVMDYPIDASWDNYYSSDLAERVALGDSGAPAFVYDISNGHWSLALYHRAKGELTYFGLDIIKTGECPSGTIFTVFSSTNSDYPVDIPYANFTYGQITNNLQPSSLTNYGNTLVNVTQTNANKRGYLGLKTINGLNTLCIGNVYPLGETAASSRVNLFYEINQPFGLIGQTDRSTNWEEFEIFFVLLQRERGNNTDRLYHGNGTVDGHDRFLAHAPWNGSPSEPRFIFDAGATGDKRVDGLGDDPISEPVLISCVCSVANDLIELRVNGKLIESKTGAEFVNIGDIFWMGSPSNSSNSYIGEVIFHRNELGGTRRQNIEGYLGHKWGVSRLFPEEHPWRYIKPYNADENLTDPWDKYFPSPMTSSMYVEDHPSGQQFANFIGIKTRTITNNFTDLNKSDLDAWSYRTQLGDPSSGYFDPDDVRVGDVIYTTANYSETLTSSVFEALYDGDTFGKDNPEWTAQAGMYLRVVGFLNDPNNSAIRTHLKLEFGDARALQVFDPLQSTSVPMDTLGHGPILRVDHPGGYPTSFTTLRIVAPIANYDGTQTQTWLT